MSHEALEAFRRRLQTDDELRARVRQARAAATIRVATEAGFGINEEELGELIDDAGTELADEHLEAIAGGLLDFPVLALKPPDKQQ